MPRSGSLRVCVNSASEFPALLWGGATFHFSDGLSSLGWGGSTRKGPGLGTTAVVAAPRPASWWRGVGRNPYSTQQGVEINGTPHAAEACVTVNSTGWHVPHRLLYEVHCCRFWPFACSSISKMNRSVVLRIHCFQGTCICWITSFPMRREHYRF